MQLRRFVVERPIQTAYTFGMSASPETFGRRVQRLRAAAGLTQAQLAAAAAVPLASLQNWEIDRREPSFRAACRLAQALGVAAEYLADTTPVERNARGIRPAGPTPKQTSKKPHAHRRGSRDSHSRQKHAVQDTGKEVRDDND
ncbi:MAG: helix-turn-helix transcriptional regulator [Planctomycetes bacterium]|nr:helix-turn-helix transcriptional regulator [Planctomycetota bacterium]